MEWKVIYQDTPFNYTTAHTLILEADSPETAFVSAYDHLTRRGLDVYTLPTHHIPTLDAAKITALGVAYDGRSGTTHIRSIQPYTVTASSGNPKVHTVFNCIVCGTAKCRLP